MQDDDKVRKVKRQDRGNGGWKHRRRFGRKEYLVSRRELTRKVKRSFVERKHRELETGIEIGPFHVARSLTTCEKRSKRAGAV